MMLYRILLGTIAVVAIVVLGVIVASFVHPSPIFVLLAVIVFGGIIWGGMALKSSGHLAAANFVLGAILLFVVVIGFYPAVYIIGSSFGAGNTK